MSEDAPSVADIADVELLRRAVTTSRSRTRYMSEPHTRWEAITDTFLLGSTYARQLCARFELDPDELVQRDGKRKFRDEE